MKRKLISILVAVMLVSGLMTIPAQAAEPDDIEASIVKGLEWLVTQQNLDPASPEYGSWGDWDRVAYTGLVLVKLEDRAYELGYDSPFDDDYPYKPNVEAGLNYAFSQASTHPLGGICFAAGGHETYNTGIAMMAIAASRTPDREVPSGPFVGQTYKQVLQGNVDFFTATQNPDGGWRYVGGDRPSDNSNTGYAVLGLRYAEAPLYGFAIPMPATVKLGLDNFINAVQDPVNGDTNDGGSWYVPGSWAWVNCLKTGNLLFEMAFFGDNESTPRVIDALDYLERHWYDPAGCGQDDAGWNPPPQYQAMYCLMKGFESLGIDTITVGGSEIDWYNEFADVIVTSQDPDGYWPSDCWGGPILCTAWALLTLERFAPPPPVDVVIEVPECACDIDGYDVNVTYTVERYIVDGTLTVKKDGTEYDTFALSGFTGTATKTYIIASDIPGTHTWRADLDVTPVGGGTPAHADDMDTINVCETPDVLNIPDQTAPFETFDFDDYLTYTGALSVSWSVSGVPADWTVEIDVDNVVTVTAPEGAMDPATLTFTASVTCCNGVVCSDSDDAIFVPNQPPDCSEAYAEPACLWPPNHKFVDISIMGVTDPDGDPVTITITAITSDEATATDKGSGGAKHAPDADGVGTDTASARAERSGNGDGRVYMIHFVASDGRGGECSGSVMVNVPHDQSAKDCPAINSGQDYDATQIN